MSRPLSAAVVVCAASAEREPLRRACVDSLLEGARRPDEIRVVVDQNPALEASVASWLPCSARLLRSAAPGIPASRNAGLRAARSDIVAFVDDDAVAEHDWLLRLLQQLSDADERDRIFGRTNLHAVRDGLRVLATIAVERIAAARPRSRVPPIARHLLA
jgi:glycosyltransferase involved in cell wall biosynthesis